MKRIISTVTAAGLLAGALMLPAMLRAEGKPEGKPGAYGEKGGKEAFMEHMKEKFRLSEDQAAKLKAAHRAKRDAAAASMAELGALTSKLHDQLEDKAAEKDLAATLDKIVAARKSMRADEEKFEASMSSILTVTQRAQMLVAMKGRERGMHGGKKGPGMRGGPKDGGWHGDKKGGKDEEKGDDD